jgi:hypothetical protein
MPLPPVSLPAHPGQGGRPIGRLRLGQGTQLQAHVDAGEDEEREVYRQLLPPAADHVQEHDGDLEAPGGGEAQGLPAPAPL